MGISLGIHRAVTLSFSHSIPFGHRPSRKETIFRFIHFTDIQVLNNSHRRILCRTPLKYERSLFCRQQPLQQRPVHISRMGYFHSIFCKDSRQVNTQTFCAQSFSLPLFISTPPLLTSGPYFMGVSTALLDKQPMHSSCFTFCKPLCGNRSTS